MKRVLIMIAAAAVIGWAGAADAHCGECGIGDDAAADHAGHDHAKADGEKACPHCDGGEGKDCPHDKCEHCGDDCGKGEHGACDMCVDKAKE